MSNAAWDMADATTLDAVRKGLPRCLNYRGEFGPELVIFLPFCKWVSQVGLARGRTLSTHRGMACFYDNLGFDEIIERDESRYYLQPEFRPSYLPRKNENTFEGLGQSVFHANLDLRTKFLGVDVPDQVSISDKPICIIHNKYTDEWSRGPVNYLSPETLSKAFQRLSRQFLVIYIRHKDPTAVGYSYDQNDVLSFDDESVVKDHPYVLDFEQLIFKFRTECGIDNTNLAKCALYSRCFNFITSQGGGAHQIAHFAGSLMSVMHKGGDEISWAYHLGYYDFLSSPPPTRLICTTDAELELSFEAHLTSKIHDRRAHLGAAGFSVAEHLSPGRWGASKFLKL